MSGIYRRTMIVNSLKLVGDVLQSAPEAMLVIDCGRIVYANAQITVTFGYSASELQGRPLHLLIPSMEHSSGADSSYTWLANPGPGVFRAPDALYQILMSETHEGIPKILDM